MDHLGEVAVWFSLFLDRGLTCFVDLSGEEALGFRFPFPGKVRLGSVPVVGFVDLLGKEAFGISLPPPPPGRE